MRALALALALVPVPAAAIMAMPSSEVAQTLPGCAGRVTQGPQGKGRDVPFAALALGAAVTRSRTSFPTGGSGTANNMIEAQREAAGLPPRAMTFDPNSPVRLRVFARRSGSRDIYERLPLSIAASRVTPYAEVFTVPTEGGGARIAALTLALREVPRAPALLTARCADGRMVRIYSAEIGQDQARQLVLRGRAPARGRVLSVMSVASGYWRYQWVDYGLRTASRLNGPN